MSTAAASALAILAGCAACGAPVAPPPARAAPEPAADTPTYHDPDHARGELPSDEVRRTVLARLRGDLDAVYAHRADKLRRYHLDEDALFAAAARELAAARTWAAYDAAIYGVLARFHDSHLGYHPPRTAAPAAGYASYRVGLETVLAPKAGTDHLLVAAVTPGGALADAGVAPGDEVVAIDGSAVSELLDREQRRRAWSRPPAARAAWARSWTHVLYGKSERPRERAIAVAARGGGAARTIAVTPVPAPHDRPDALSATTTGDLVVIHVRDLDGGAAVRDQVDRVVAAARGAARLVIDLRGVTGGVDTIGYRLVGGLVEGTAAIGSARVLLAPQTRAARPKWRDLPADADGWSAPIALTAPGQPAGGGFHGRAAVVVDGACASTCEVVAAALRADLHATVVGETTAGSSGAPIRIELPVGGDVAIPTWVLTAADGHAIEDDGVVPDVVVVPTPDGLAAGRDEPLDAALAQT